MTAANLTTGPIKRGIVRFTRSNGTLKSALVGGIHERLAPRKVPYPFLVYSEVSAPLLFDWGTEADGGHVEIHSLWDLTIYSLKKVEAQNLDALLAGLFSSLSAAEDLAAFIPGQTVLLCRRTSSTPTGPGRDDEGQYLDQIGGTYEIWTDQPLT
jgi:hypothetical protein